MSVALLHLDVDALPTHRGAELSTAAASLIGRLHQHGVQVTVLVQCSSAADAAARLAALEPAAAAAAARLSFAQPSQLPVSLRLGLDQLAPAQASNIAMVSVSDSGAAAALATSLGCGAAEHLPCRTASHAQLHALTLQAVACLAASRAAVPPLVVGYVMKESRQLALSQQGMLPLLPAPPPGTAAGTAAGAAAGVAAQRSGAAERPVVFVPLDPGSSLAPQLARCHIVLQKLTDCLQPSGGSGAVAAFNAEAQALLGLLRPGQQAQQAQHATQGAAAALSATTGSPPQGSPLPPRTLAPSLVDPAEALLPIMDRAELLPHLEAAAAAVRRRAIPMRAPASLLLTSFDAAGTPRQLAAAGVGLPCIVKPQAACGVAEAHQMAFVLHSSGFADLEVPLPAVAQEYVDHGGVVWKVYAAGEQVYWAQRKSTPDLGILARLLAENPDADIPTSIAFDSLKSLPTTLPWLRQLAADPAQAMPDKAAAVQQEQLASSGAGTADLQPPAQSGGAGTQAASGDTAAQPAPPGYELMRRSTFEAVAAALRQRLGLTLFGFDLVFDRVAGELVIIDVNYFPSFKGVPEAPAALQAALRQRYAQHLAAQQAQQGRL